MEAGRLRTDRIEQGGLGGGHPDLATILEPRKQEGPAVGVEMRRDFVQQQDRRRATARGDQFGVGKDEAQQNCLLLSGGSSSGRLVLGDVRNG